MLDLLQLEFVLIEQDLDLIHFILGLFDFFRGSPDGCLHFLLNFRLHLEELIAFLNKLCLFLAMTNQNLVLLLVEGLISCSTLLICSKSRLKLPNLNHLVLLLSWLLLLHHV